MSIPFISVVIPAYNEETRLGQSLEAVEKYLRSRQIDYEIVIVNDGSTDQTAGIASAYANGRVRVFHNQRNRGKGYTIRRGMLESRGAYALFTDADLSTPIEEMRKLEKFVVGGPCHIAFGSRDVAGSQVEVHQSPLRENAGKVFNRMVKLSTRLPFGDTQCGFKLFEMDPCREIFLKLRIERFAFDVEILYVAKKWGLAMREVPVVWRHVEGSKVSLFQDAPLMGLDLIQILCNDLRGLYEPA